MKRIMDGKMYNTETAEVISSWDNGYLRSDFNFCAETLYKTKEGAYFLHGEGRAMTGGTRWAEDIRPFPEGHIIKWHEKRGVTMPEELAAELGVVDA